MAIKGLKSVYDSKDDIPAGLEEMFEEKNGKWIMQRVEGMASTADVTRLQGALDKEKRDHAKTQETLHLWTPLGESPEAVQAILDEVPTLKAAATAGGDEKKIQALVDAGIAKAKTPLEREIAKNKIEIEKLTKTNGELAGTIAKAKLETAIRKAADGAKVIPHAVEDVILNAERMFEVQEDGTVVTRDGVGVQPGLTPEAWLEDVKEKRPHWWPTSEGGGAGGSQSRGGVSGENPWRRDQWNITKQAQYRKQHGDEKAAAMAKQAGSALSATKPPPAAT